MVHICQGDVQTFATFDYEPTTPPTRDQSDASTSDVLVGLIEVILSTAGHYVSSMALKKVLMRIEIKASA
jgi:hypothetical protein